MKIIPAIDLQGGKCVRLYQGDFEKSTQYGDDPVAIARKFADLAASDLHIVDLDGARSGTQGNREIIAAIAAQSGMEVQIGGGIRERNTVSDWLAAGASRCVIGSLGITDPDTVKSWLVKFGAQHIVLALDVKISDAGVPLVTTHGWTQSTTTSIYDCIEDFLEVGLQHVLCTDVSRDGAMAGPNLQLYASIVERYPDLQLQASGGVRNIADMQALRAMGVPAAITGRALLDGKITAAEIASFLQNA